MRRFSTPRSLVFSSPPTMSGAVVKFLRETYGKASLLDCITAGGWKAAIDGSLA